jgi:hypothetical protein
MNMNRLIITFAFVIYVVTAKESGIDEKAALDREAMYKSFGGWDSTTLSWVVRDLVNEVRGYKELVSEQGEMLKKALDQLDGLKNRIDVMRSEVRLISQQKLTWHNSTLGGRHYSDFAVDGVYRMQNDDNGMNPIQHTDDQSKGPNNMIVVDLGALFKIHTVKLWKRVGTCCDVRNVGLLIYADDTLIGATSEAPYLQNLPVSGDVYASKIYVKQAKTMDLNLLEIQVFGTGPFGKDEVHC